MINLNDPNRLISNHNTSVHTLKDLYYSQVGSEGCLLHNPNTHNTEKTPQICGVSEHSSSPVSYSVCHHNHRPLPRSSSQ